MSNPDPTERQTRAEGVQPSGYPGVESTADWSQFLDQLISWAIAQGDAAADQIYAYLAQRSRRPPLSGI